MSQAGRERVTKHPEERKQELIDAARRLFIKNGYEETAVSDIVGDVGVAQGTFYYYFGSKDEILEAVIDKDMALLEDSVRRIVQDDRTDPLAKINAMVNGIIGISFSRREIMDYLHQESNAVMHEKMERQMIERLVPLMAVVVEEGTQKGEFDVQHPTEAVEFLLGSLVYFFHHPEIFADPLRSRKMQSTLETILGRALGTKEGRFVLQFERSDE